MHLFFSASLQKNAEALFSIFPWVLQLSQGKSKTTVNQFFLLNHFSYFFNYYYSFFDGGGGVKQGALFGNSLYTIYCIRLQEKKHTCLYVYVMVYLCENSELLNVLNLYINLLSRAELNKWSDSI